MTQIDVSSAWTNSRSRWAAIVLAIAVAALRPDLPLAPVLLLAAYFLLTAVLAGLFSLSLPPQALGLLDIAAVSAAVLASGGERSPVYVVYLATALDVGSRVATGQAATLAAVSGLGYALAAWGASLAGVYPFDAALAATRGFLFLAAALTSSSLSQAANLARTRASEADALNNMMRLAVAAALDMPAVLAAVVKQACQGLHADCGVACLSDSSAGEAAAAACGLGDDVDAVRNATVGDTLCLQAMTSGQVVVFSAAVAQEGSSLMALSGAVATAACAPLALDRNSIGVIWIARHKGPPFSQTEVDLLALMGQQAALAVRNARLHTLEKRTVAELQAAEQAKTEFLSTVSHELRTPLTAIRASAGLLLDSGAETLPPTQLRLMRSISRNTDRLSNMVTDLLDMARLQSGRLPLTCELIDVRPIVRSCVAALRPLLEQKAQAIDVRLPHDLPRVMADRRRVEQILTNLLSNAHKYTPRGGCMAVAVACEGTDVLVTVTDNGPGVPSEERDLIFGRFYRGAAARRGEPSGAGLGLAVAKSLVELHGGQIGYRDAAGGGSAFFFSLPLQGPKESEP
jgi:signal transduction histidine kinase